MADSANREHLTAFVFFLLLPLPPLRFSCACRLGFLFTSFRIPSVVSLILASSTARRRLGVFPPSPIGRSSDEASDPPFPSRPIRLRREVGVVRSSSRRRSASGYFRMPRRCWNLPADGQGANRAPFLLARFDPGHPGMGGESMILIESF